MKKYIKTLMLFSLAVFVLFFTFNINSVNASPVCKPTGIEYTLRAEFSTDYSKSSEERKNNIELAVKALNNTFVDIKGEYSFNKIVGVRSEKRGYKLAKIIVNGKFIEGVGGGVCQVSTTLYNAVLLSGLKVSEYHPHSLRVNYVKPSFDAMVNSGSADLKFINTTNNMLYIKAFANGEKIIIKIYGEKMKEKYILESADEKVIPMPEYIILIDKNNEYPELHKGESKVLCYGKDGLESKGYRLKILNGKIVERKLIRKDRYKPIQGQIVIGNAEKEISS